jgi:hypothetical protein
MILSNVEIQRAMEEGRLVIAPEPMPRRPEAGQYCPYDTHAVDLRLYREITVPQAGPYHYDVTEPGTLSEVIAKHSKRHTLTDETPYPLQPPSKPAAKPPNTSAKPRLSPHLPAGPPTGILTVALAFLFEVFGLPTLRRNGNLGV